MLGRRLGLGLGGEEGIGKGGGGLQRCVGKQHMWTVPPRVGVVVIGVDGGDGSSSSSAASSSSSLNSFCKDGRQISIGDCALFKPPQDSPPFIGIVRCFSLSKENILTLGVNWLYRPSEVKLNKGILLEAAPNEIFYSFHKDEIPAASLLHPCKIAFLPKGADLPSGISSFVCRRVYDISNSCLWWLTDQDYINERQEEVDQLLYKTQIEMHATVQPNGRSPKRGPTSQLKSGSDCVQNSGSSFPAKGKRSERADQVSEPIKRERSSKMEDADSVLGRSESFMKHEIAKITEKGGLVDIDGVEKFVQLMFPERGEKKVDLACRSLLAGVIASTDKLDCLNHFVQLKGLSVLDEWLQEVHKGKVGDSVSPRDNDKSVEEFISASLRALDKLPVNLHALQTCNIGKSVNHLRSHKNAEIQKKARTLVDTWKKRVEDEMNINDAKSGSNQTVHWSARSRLPDVVSSGNKQIAGSSDVVSKSSGGLLISKSASAKLVQEENACKSASASPGSVKSASLHPLMNANLKDHARGSGVSSISDVPMTTSRDEKSTGSSQSHNNSQSCSSDHAKAGGIPGKEDARSPTAGSGKNLTGPSRHKKSVNGFSGSPVSGREVGSGRNSSLHRGSIPEKVSQSGLASEKAVDVPAEVNSHKLIVKISSRSRSPAQNASGGSLEEQSVMNSRASSPSPSDKPDQLDPVAKEKVDACKGIVSSEINVESWQSSDLKDSLMSCDDGDGSPNAVLGDERLKTGESLKRVSDASNSATLLSCREFMSGRLPDASLGSINALVESCVKLSEPCVADSVMDDVGMNLLASVAAGEMLTSEMTSPAGSPQRDRSTALHSSAGNDQSKNVSTDCSPAEAVVDTSTLQKIGEYGTSLTIAEEMTSGEQPQGVEAGTEDNRNADDSTKAALISEECLHKEMKTDVSLLSELKVEDDASTMEVTKDAIETGASSENKLVKPVTYDFKDGKKSQKSCDERHSENVEELKCDAADDPVVTNVENSDNETDDNEEKESIALCELKSVGSSCKVLSEPPVEDKIITANSATRKLTSSVVEEKEHAFCATENVSLPSMEVPSMDAKVAFDLNEGFSADDGKYAEPVYPASSARSSIHPVVNQLPFPASSVPTILPAPIPPAAAKGPFVPPNDFLRTKVELGWKGSAATSAFRPAEPRRVLEMQLLAAGAGQHSDIGYSRQSRPPLNIDLNVPDEGIMEDAESRDSIMETVSLPKAICERTHNLTNASSRGSGGLNLDLNQMDDATDIWSSSVNNNRRLDVSLPSVKLSSAVRPSGAEAGSKRDFDLNDGPALDDIGAEPSTSGQQARSSLLSQQPVSTLKMNNSDLGSFSAWFPPGSTFSAVTIPSILPNRGDQPLPVVTAGGQPRMMGPSGGGIPFTHDVYRGSVLSSSPAVSFPSTPFQYNVFPYGPSFPLPPASFSASSTTYVDPSSGGRLCFPPVHSQILGASGAVTSPYIRPYVVSLHDGSSTFDNSKKWSRPGLDLNTGPGGSEAEGKEDASSLAPRHFSIASSQAQTEDQARMHQVTSGVLKRKEPEGGWDSYKQSSWQ